MGILGSMCGWLIAKKTERQKADELFLTALDFMGGGTQRRNLGIAAITMYWRKFPEHKQLCLEMLVGAAIYLLTESKQKDAGHELFNLNRIMVLIQDVSSKVQDRGGVDQLNEVLKRRLEDYCSEPKPKKGLWVSDKQLDLWKSKLS